MRRRFVLLTSIFCLSFGLLLFGNLRQTWAANGFCTPDESLYVGISIAHPSLDIRRTVQNMVFSGATDGPMYALSGRNTTQMMNCAHLLTTDFTGLQQAFTDSGCETAKPDPTCSDFTQTYDGKVTGLPGTKAFNKAQISGSLIGVANYLQGAVENEPVPVNLAYFWNDSIRNVPLASQALAADVQYGNAPFIGFVLEIWKVTRNLSYGILSIVMLVVGVSIMMRKKLSPQLAVTAQYALPRIVLAVVLITFSYPIGAVMASSMRFFKDLSVGLLQNVQTSALIGTTISTTGSASLSGIGLIALLLLVLALAGTGIGVVAVIATVLLIAVAVVLWVFVYIKAAMLYIKLVLSIVFAPFAFALGAIPGNETSTSKWLKSALSNVLGYVLSIAYAHMILVIITIAIAKGFSASTFGGPTTGAIIVAIFAPVFVVYGLIQATKVPAKISAMIMGEDKKPGGRR